MLIFLNNIDISIWNVYIAWENIISGTYYCIAWVLDVISLENLKEKPTSHIQIQIRISWYQIEISIFVLMLHTSTYSLSYSFEMNSILSLEIIPIRAIFRLSDYVVA